MSIFDTIGNLFSSKTQTDAIKSASRKAERSAERNLNFQKDIFNQQKELNAPFRDLGIQARDLISEELGKPLTETDSFKFAQGSQEKALSRILAARGIRKSGEGIKNSLGITQNLTANEISRRDSLLGASLGAGQTATGATTSALGNLGIGGSNVISNLGTTQTNARLAQGRVTSDLFSTVGNSFAKDAGQAASLFLGRKT